jgi:hypothetical protein
VQNFSALVLEDIFTFYASEPLLSSAFSMLMNLSLFAWETLFLFMSCKKNPRLRPSSREK